MINKIINALFGLNELIKDHMNFCCLPKKALEWTNSGQLKERTEVDGKKLVIKTERDILEVMDKNYIFVILYICIEVPKLTLLVRR